MLSNRLLLLLVVLLNHCSYFICGQLREEDRLEEYEARGYTWPPTMNPDTPGWSKLMMRRFRQLEFIEDYDNRYDGYASAVTSAYVAPHFTTNGWGLTRGPQALVDELRKVLMEGMANSPPLEDEYEEDSTIEGAKKPFLVDPKGLAERALSELKPYHEAWTGIPLIGAIAYGLRVYRNDSNLHMHLDQSHTHVISCILHIDHDDDPESEPWPIVIEDYQGNTNEVFLESGDLLFYESSKCLHGRPKRFKGEWYSSIFVHYYPADNWNIDDRGYESEYGIPKHWENETPDEEEMDVEYLQVSDSAFMEPTCEDDWCALEDSVKWYGPAKYGEVLTTGGVIFPLDVTHEDYKSQQQLSCPDDVGVNAFGGSLQYRD